MATRRRKSPAAIAAEASVTTPRSDAKSVIEAIEETPAIEESRAALEAVQARRTKTVRALRTESGIYGRTKYRLVQGNHYTLPVEVAEHLARTGRVI